MREVPVNLSLEHHGRMDQAPITTDVSGEELGSRSQRVSAEELRVLSSRYRSRPVRTIAFAISSPVTIANATIAMEKASSIPLITSRCIRLAIER